MSKHQQAKEKRARALKYLDARDRHNSAEMENPGRSESERKRCRHSVSQSALHTSTSSTHKRNVRRESLRQSGSRNSRRETRSCSSSSHRSRSGHESHRKHSRRHQSLSEEPPFSARELLSQQKNTDELRQLKSKVTKTPSEGSLTALKVVDHEFQYAGNKKQYDFYQSVVQHLDLALDADDQDEASKQINAGKSLLLEWSKHLLLAVTYGWDTVDCYIVEPLASDSEDEKRIKRALKEGKSRQNEKAGNVHLKGKRFFCASEKPTIEVEKPFAGGFKPRRQVPPLHRSKINMFSLLEARLFCPGMQICQYPRCCLKQFSQHKQCPKHQCVK